MRTSLGALSQYLRVLWSRAITSQAFLPKHLATATGRISAEAISEGTRWPDAVIFYEPCRLGTAIAEYSNVCKLQGNPSTWFANDHSYNDTTSTWDETLNRLNDIFECYLGSRVSLLMATKSTEIAPPTGMLSDQ